MHAENTAPIPATTSSSSPSTPCCDSWILPPELQSPDWEPKSPGGCVNFGYAEIHGMTVTNARFIVAARDLLDDARAIMVNLRDEVGWPAAAEWIETHDNSLLNDYWRERYEQRCDFCGEVPLTDKERKYGEDHYEEIPVENAEHTERLQRHHTPPRLETLPLASVLCCVLLCLFWDATITGR